MNRLAIVFALGCAGTGVGAAPVPKENDAARLARVYGTPYEFKGPSSYKMDGEQLRVFLGAPDVVPPDVLDRRGRMAAVRRVLRSESPIGAPRVWREVKGDFTLITKVVFPGDTDDRRRTSGPRVAGVLAWSESDNHITLVRAGDRGSSVQLSFTHPNGARGAEAAFDAPPAELLLRLRRVGATVTSGYSLDGKKWTDFFPDGVEWGQTIRVGVYAKNLSDAPFEAAFSASTLTVPK
jgi:hypothetical protein